MKRTAIITGANGFVGTRLCDELTLKGYKVYGILRNISSYSERLKQLDSFEPVYCDMKEISCLSEIMRIRGLTDANFTAGEQWYDFIYISDVVQGLVCLGEKGKENHSYYIGSGHPAKLKDYILKLKDIVNPAKEVHLGAIPFYGMSASLEDFDCSKLVKDTGYQAKVEFEEGIMKMKEF